MQSFKERLTQLYIEETNLKNELKQLETIFVNEIQLTLGDEFRSDNLKEEKGNLVTKKQKIETEIRELDNKLTDVRNLSDQNKLNLKKLESEKKTLEKNIYSLKRERERERERELMMLKNIKISPTHLIVKSKVRLKD